MIILKVLKEITESQKAEIKVGNNFIKREILGRISPDSGRAVILTGIRRSGKSTLLKQLMRKLSCYNYFNFEDNRAIGLDVADFTKFDEIFENNKKKILFFDEIQNIEKWELYIRTALDRGFAIFITGSNATLMSRELGTKLTGRHLKYELFPFSYSEFLKFKNLEDNEKNFTKYFNNGGFPEYLKKYEKSVLQSLFDDIITKDIIVRYKIKNSDILKKIAQYLISNTGNLYSYSSISKLFDIKSRVSTQQYISYLVNCYLFFSVPLFSYKLKIQMRNPKKIYAIDNGLITANSLSFSKDKEKLLENLVFITLRKNTKDIYYHKKNKECDFIVRDGKNALNAIQVCYEVNQNNQNRELEGLYEAMDILNLKKGSIITFEQEDKLKYKGKIIDLIPLKKFIGNPIR